MRACDRVRLDAYLDRALDAKATAAFEEHLASCPACSAQVRSWRTIAEAVVAWDASRGADGVDPASENRLVRRARSPERKPPRSTVWRGLAWAVSVLALVGATLVFWVFHAGDEGARGGVERNSSLAASTAPKTEELQLVVLKLPDGHPPPAPRPAAGAVLDSGSGELLAQLGEDRIALSHSGRARVLAATSKQTRLSLQSGSVAVDVEPRRKGGLFQVESGDVVVTVVGTRFRVLRSESDAVEVAVQRGKVLVERAGTSHVVSAGQSARFDPHGDHLEAMSSADEAAAFQGLNAADNPAGEASAAEPDVWEATPRPAPQGPHRRAVTQGRDLESWRQWVLQGRYAEAESALTARVRVAPSDTEAQSLLGDCQRKAGEWPAAVATYRGVIAQGDVASANRARFLAATILEEKLKDPSAAISLLRQYLQQGAELRPLEAAATVRLARALSLVHEDAEARALLERVIRDHEGSAAAAEARALLEH
jgi:hypothetical protein